MQHTHRQTDQQVTEPEGHHSGRVAWADTDAGGRIHHTAALRWAEVAEHNLFRELNPSFPAGDFPRKSVQATYHSVLAFDDEFEVQLWAGAVGRTSVTFEWEIRSGDVLCIEGRHTVVHVDGVGRPAPLPAWLHDGLSRPADAKDRPQGRRS